MGTDGNGLNYKKIMLVSAPAGKRVTPLVSENELDVFEIEAMQVTEYQSKLPIVRDKRSDLYRHFYNYYHAER